MTKIEFFLVGGAVRDGLMGVESNDLDFTVVAKDFNEMRDELLAMGFMIFLETPKFLTIRARFPKGHKHERKVADFVLARKETGFSDGRRPDLVEGGTLLDDLRRRDFTMNAIAKATDGTIVDPFNGQADISAGIIRAVGNADDRIKEDGLRILRAIRFSVTKGFVIDEELVTAINRNVGLLRSVSVERVREELFKMFMHDTVMAFEAMMDFPGVKRIVFDDMGIRLKPTLEK